MSVGRSASPRRSTPAAIAPDVTSTTCDARRDELGDLADKDADVGRGRSRRVAPVSVESRP